MGTSKRNLRAQRIPPPSAELQIKLVQFIKAGARPSAAATGSGVSRVTFWTWMEQIPAFRAAIEMAEGEARIATQVELRKKQPAAWLGRSGGGETPNLPALPPRSVQKKNRHPLLNSRWRMKRQATNTRATQRKSRESGHLSAFDRRLLDPFIEALGFIALASAQKGRFM
jgi:hypothetical protein